jgi:DNA-binding TFAR19-related protein (PDSD5 family)
MSTEKKTGLGKLIQKLGNFIEGIFNAAERAWNKVQPEVQKAIVGGSTIVNIINDNVKLAPDALIRLIQLALPNLNRAELENALNKMAEALNVTNAIEALTLEETLQNLAKYLEQKKSGTNWAGVSSLAAKILATVFAPAGTKWDVFESLMLFAYQTFVKKK